MYTKPELMLEQFEVEDVITTSGAGSDIPTTTNDPFEIPQISIEDLVGNANAQ